MATAPRKTKAPPPEPTEAETLAARRASPTASPPFPAPQVPDPATPLVALLREALVSVGRLEDGITAAKASRISTADLHPTLLRLEELADAVAELIASVGGPSTS